MKTQDKPTQVQAIQEIREYRKETSCLLEEAKRHVFNKYGINHLSQLPFDEEDKRKK